jgi:Rab-3A-interacting protein
VDALQTEVTALKALVITSTPAKPNRHLYAQLDGRGGPSPASSAPGSPAKERPSGGTGCGSGEGESQEAKYIDPILRQVIFRPFKMATLIFLNICAALGENLNYLSQN